MLDIWFKENFIRRVKMGLDVYCNEVNVRLGSYSRAKELKEILVYSCIFHCNVKIKEFDQKMYQLEDYSDEWIQVFSDYTDYKGVIYQCYEILGIGYDKNKLIDYNVKGVLNYDKIDYFIGDFEGLTYWLRHNETCGYIESDQVYAIIKFLKLVLRDAVKGFNEKEEKGIINYMRLDVDKIDEMTDEEIFDSFYLSSVLKESDNTGEDLCFG